MKRESIIELPPGRCTNRPYARTLPRTTPTSMIAKANSFQRRRVAIAVSIKKNDSRGKTLAESDEQLRRSLDADSPAEQGPQQAPLFGQEAEPCLAVGSHTQVGFALMTVLDLQSAVP